jgi:hypothetical protein
MIAGISRIDNTLVVSNPYEAHTTAGPSFLRSERSSSLSRVGPGSFTPSRSPSLTASIPDIMEQPPPELAVFPSYQCVIVGRLRRQVTSLQVIEVAA